MIHQSKVLLPISNIGQDAVCQNELCESEHTELFYCKHCSKFFCGSHKDHSCQQEKLFEAPRPEALPPITARICKVCAEEIPAHDWNARLIVIALKDGGKFSFYRCARCEKFIQDGRQVNKIQKQKSIRA